MLLLLLPHRESTCTRQLSRVNCSAPTVKDGAQPQMRTYSNRATEKLRSIVVRSSSSSLYQRLLRWSRLFFSCASAFCLLYTLVEAVHRERDRHDVSLRYYVTLFTLTHSQSRFITKFLIFQSGSIWGISFADFFSLFWWFPSYFIPIDHFDLLEGKKTPRSSWMISL